MVMIVRVTMFIVRMFLDRNVMSKPMFDSDFSDRGFRQLLNFSDRSAHHDRLHALGLIGMHMQGADHEPRMIVMLFRHARRKGALSMIV